MPAKSDYLLRTALSLQMAFALLPLGNVALASTELAFPQVRGKSAKPFAQTNVAAIAFVFVSTDCPISNRYAPEVQRLQEKFGRVRFWLVYPNTSESDEAVARHIQEYRHTASALRDPEHKLVRLARARVTPEAALFSASGELLYHGRIDDRDVDFGKQRPEPARRDFEAALEAVLKGEKPAAASTKAVGCPIR